MDNRSNTQLVKWTIGQMDNWSNGQLVKSRVGQTNNCQIDYEYFLEWTNCLLDICLILRRLVASKLNLGSEKLKKR